MSERARALRVPLLALAASAALHAAVVAGLPDAVVRLEPESRPPYAVTLLAAYVPARRAASQR